MSRGACIPNPQEEDRVMARHLRIATWREPTRRRPPILYGVMLLGAAATLACAREAPTEMTIELPLVTASHAVHTGTTGRSFELEMSQELTTTVTGDPDGVGTAVLTLNMGQQTICWSLSASGIALPATASHIHRAPPGLSGPIVQSLSAPDANGLSSGCAEDVDRDLIVSIFTDPTAYYVNVHTTQYPPGAIRSQLQ
jgi:hypothetical protein